MSYTLFLMLICENFIVFTLGIIIGFLLKKENYSLRTNNKKTSTNNQMSQTSIDDTKIVLGLDTNKFIKKYNDIGKTSTIENDTINSVNKLKSMKGK
jgi:hypothetical protein